MWIYLVYVIVLTVGTYADKSFTVGNFTTKVRGQSGKIYIYRNGNESDGVTIDFSGIEEVDTVPSHTYNNFAKLNFTFSNLENTTYAGSNVTVMRFNFTSNITIADKAATLTSYVFIFTSDGNITVDGTNLTVKSGEMKFNVKITNWPFCGSAGVTCTKGSTPKVGEYLDFTVEIRGKKTPNKTANGKKGEYDLGDGASVVVPTKVLYDNTSSEDMPAGYPELQVNGSKAVFVFRFKKFNTSALYDPVVSLGSGGSNDSGSTTPATTPAPEQSISGSGVSAKVLGRSGKIELTNSGSTGDSAKNKITVEFDNLQEMKSDGSAIKNPSHNFNTFASQDFTFGPTTDDTYPNTSIGVKKITFEATLNNGATFKVYMYVFKSDGQITQENETTDVKAGNVKFNIEIASWTFCNGTNCQQGETGTYLDVDIVIKGTGNAKVEKGTTYNLGSGTVMLSKKIKVDGNSDLQDMVDGYPMLVTQGSKQIFQFRFPKFTTRVMYDPTIELNPDSGSEAVRVAMTTIWLAINCLILQKL